MALAEALSQCSVKLSLEVIHTSLLRQLQVLYNGLHHSYDIHKVRWWYKKIY